MSLESVRNKSNLHVYNIFTGIVKCVEYMRDYKDEIKEHFKLMNSIEASKQFKTISVQLPRSMGNSYMADLLLDYFNDSILLLPNSSHLVNRISKNKFRMSTLHSIRTGAHRISTNPDKTVVIVDPESFYRVEEIHEIYDLFNAHGVSCYIFLG